jgi:RimJ/RimL family protein N-acetyltransferase
MSNSSADGTVRNTAMRWQTAATLISSPKIWSPKTVRSDPLDSPSSAIGLHRVTLIKRVAVSHPGLGYGRALVRNVVDAIFRETDAHRIWLGVFPENIRAQRAYEAVGFRREGIARGTAFFNGVHRDELVMALLRAQWSSGKTAK